MHMRIWNPVANYTASLVARRQRFRCLVDGQGEYGGVPLPVGTEDEILAWLERRYKVLGQLFVIDWKQASNGECLIWYSIDTYSKSWTPAPETKRYLVEVDGIEKVFVLRPVPDGLLAWHPSRALTWDGQAQA